jgi:hypothetical protein
MQGPVLFDDIDTWVLRCARVVSTHHEIPAHRNSTTTAQQYIF